jgi:hypothetical protein
MIVLPLPALMMLETTQKENTETPCPFSLCLVAGRLVATCGCPQQKKGGEPDNACSAASAAHIDMDPCSLGGWLLAADHHTFLDLRRNSGVHRSALALFAGRLCTAGGTFAAISLEQYVSLMIRCSKEETQERLT